jgi:CheY-like chemotaxis protein
MVGLCPRGIDASGKREVFSRAASRAYRARKNVVVLPWRVVQMSGPLPPDEVPVRTGPELLRDQLSGLDAWHRDSARRALIAGSVEQTREQRLDGRRRMDALRRANTALIAQADETVEQSLALLMGGVLRSVVVHRDEWMRRKLAVGLAEAGLKVVAEASDGADGLGIAVAEQPDVLVIEDRLPSMSGLDVVRATTALSPKTLIAAQVDHESLITAMLEAGARVVFSRQLSPDLVCEQVLGLLRAGPSHDVVPASLAVDLAGLGRAEEGSLTATLLGP